MEIYRHRYSMLNHEIPLPLYMLSIVVSLFDVTLHFV